MCPSHPLLGAVPGDSGTWNRAGLRVERLEQSLVLWGPLTLNIRKHHVTSLRAHVRVRRAT